MVHDHIHVLTRWRRECAQKSHLICWYTKCSHMATFIYKGIWRIFFFFDSHVLVWKKKLVVYYLWRTRGEQVRADNSNLATYVKRAIVWCLNHGNRAHYISTVIYILQSMFIYVVSFYSHIMLWIIIESQRGKNSRTNRVYGSENHTMNSHCQLLYLTQKPHLVINETPISQIFANAGEDTIPESSGELSY